MADLHRWGTAFVMVVATVAACRPARPPAVAPGPEATPVTLPGLEVLLRDSAHLVAGQRVGLVSNQAGVDHRAISGVDFLRSRGVNLVALFSPEHGFRGAADPGEAVASTVDSATRLPIYSLYGAAGGLNGPTAAMLDGIDVLLVDLQDVGARYYTWLASTVEVMRSGARAGLPVVVLDRPNPIGGAVQGGVLDPAYISGVGRLAVPARHGLTLGEEVLLARHDLRIAIDLRVVPVSGWRRDLPYERTGLPFIPPSPNLKDLESLFHYAGLCLFEATALSVGRGTDAPFHQVGAPWLDTAAVLRRLRASALPGVEFEGTQFTPRRPGDGKYADTLVTGIRLRMLNPESYDPLLTAVTLLAGIQAVHPDRIGIAPRRFDRLAGGTDLRVALEGGVDPAVIVAGWGPGIEAFLARRRPFLLYP